MTGKSNRYRTVLRRNNTRRLRGYEFEEVVPWEELIADWRERALEGGGSDGG